MKNQKFYLTHFRKSSPHEMKNSFFQMAKITNLFRINKRTCFFLKRLWIFVLCGLFLSYDSARKL